MKEKEEVAITPVSIPTSWFHEKDAGKESMPLMHLSSGGLPILCVKMHNVGFNFLMDTSVRHNLIDPCLMEWIVVPEPTGNEMRDRYAPTEILHERLPEQTIMCKDGVERPCEMIRLKFGITEVDGSTREHSGTFALDPSMSRFFLLPQSSTTPEGVVQRHKTIAGVLGTDFLMEHEFCLDFGGSTE